MAKIYDLVVVGGGPGGTAAAFRGRELGLETVVLEYDDVLKRIRDYSKDKLILPTFGGGDRMAFPRGGDMIDALRFGPIDKDEMCSRWKVLYSGHELEVRIGVEMTGVEPGRSGLLCVRGWNHSTREDVELEARHVVLALGRGVPRRFDIPGNTEGIAFRLNDAADYLGRPACVIGGGTSAAEAVIAISNAKAASKDASAIYWSYRGDRLPRVSKALADVFFEAYIGNGNIRYVPLSEPTAVVVGDDRRDYLAIRVDRREMQGRPIETTHLEFPKKNCLACIGEDIPEALLASAGIRMAIGGPRGKKRMVVNQFLESEQKNVFLIGDILSQAYFETEDFDADPASFREVKHRGNIKMALRDGVFVANVIRQRLDGCQEIDVRIEDAEEVHTKSRPFVVSTAFAEEAEELDSSVDEVDESVATLIRILPSGVQEDEYPIAGNSLVTIGRSGCDLSYPDDTTLAPRHASIQAREESFVLRDEGSPTGVFVRIPHRRKIPVEAGDLVRLGRQFLVFSRQNGSAYITHFDQRGQEKGRHRLPGRTMIVGRQAPDLTLSADDATLSRRQLAISNDGSTLWLKDLKSINGSFLRVRSTVELRHGDQFRVGQQRFVLSSDAEAVLDTVDGPKESTNSRFVNPGFAGSGIRDLGFGQAADGAAGSASPAEDQASGSTVSFRGTGTICTVEPGMTICEVAESNGLGITAECHSGICGSDPVRIVAGIENVVDGPDDEESDTLQDLCDLEPGPYRLACKLRVKGPVEVEIL